MNTASGRVFVRWRSFSRTFILSESMAGVARDLFYRSHCTVNSKSIGRHRRGSVMLSGVDCKRLSNDQWCVRVTFTVGVSAFIKVGGGKFQKYRFADYRKVLRRLAMTDASR